VPPAAFDHAREHGLDRVHSAKHVDLDQALDGLDAGRGERAVRADPGVGDEDVDRPEAGFDGTHGRVDLRTVRHVRRRHQAPVAEGAVHLVEIVGAAGDEPDTCAARDGLGGHGPADTARGARHDDGGSLPLHGRDPTDRVS
jgi:hypothetical protein